MTAYMEILIGFGILFAGVIVSRSIQAIQFRRLGAEKRDALLRGIRRFRLPTLIVAFLLIILFVASAVVIPEAFARLSRLMTICSFLYVVLINTIVMLYYAHAKCGIIFIAFALFAKIIAGIALILFCYFMVRGVLQFQ